MSTSTFVSQPARGMREWTGCSPDQPYLAVSAMRSVNAYRSRVFHALTVPEYIETWFCAPRSIPGSIRVFPREDSFSITYSSAEGERFRVLCSYRVCRRSKLLFSWKHDTQSETAVSLVKIRLCGDFGRTTVRVTHAGLTRFNQRWHQDLWEASLERLHNLF